MCGIGGEVRFDGRAPDIEAVARMVAAEASRGPDGEGLWRDGPVALGHRRLAIIDLSAAGAQPMLDDELGLAIVFNGCIYNHRQLREELRGLGHRFRSTSDTEVILKAWHQWGVASLDRLYGMFAFALVERTSGRLVLVRDRLGIKPLYVSQVGGRLRFASTLPALLAAGDVDTAIDPVALHHYLSFHAVVPAPLTVLAGVRKLPPATVRIVQADGSAEDTTYWRPEHTRDPARAGWSRTDWQEALLEATRVAVERRMVADVEVGVLLSGGFDSSLVVALLAQAGQPGLRTFSIGFEAVGEREGDEFAYSDLVAQTYGTQHERIMIGADRLLPGLDGAIRAMSEPMTSHDVVAFYLLSEQVSRAVKVVQSGQGADEILAGYDWYPPLAGVAPEAGVSSYLREFRDRSDTLLREEVVATGHLAVDDVSGRLVADSFAAPGADTVLDRALRLDSTVMLVDDPVKRVDNMTMAWGLEARVPFLDHELVELAARCPPELKLAGGGKGVLKDASRGLLPAEVIDRTKGYFPVPALQQLEGVVLQRVRDALTDPAARARGLYRPAYVDRLLADPNGTRATLGPNALWQLGLLEMWLQTHDIH